MLDRDRYPTGVPCWIDSGRTDAKAATDFYGGLFGWEFENRSPEGQNPYYVGMIDGRDVAAIGQQDEQLDPPIWNTYVLVDDADAAASKAVAAGGGVAMAPFDIGTAGRMAVLTDPTGAAFCVWQGNEFHGARAVNEPNTWNFSDLHTRDPEEAMAFYGKLFGWKADDPEAEGYGMIYKAGYGDHLAKSDPEIYERLEGFGAERSFADVVASISSITDNGQYPPGTPSYWGITFSVADADASAAKVEELGGKVVVPVFDTEWTRTAVAADPDGAMFTLGQFTPPEH
jgi:uncharacterized protein